MKIVTVIQARMGSSRLKGKVLFPLGTETVLEEIYRRVSNADSVGVVTIATSTESQDDPIFEICQKRGFLCFRGSENDLLDRHYQAGRKLDAEAVVKIPSDCPLIDPWVIDQVIKHFIASSADYVSNLHPPTFLDGNDVEIFKFSALKTAWQSASHQDEREHTTPYFWKHPDRFHCENVTWDGVSDSAPPIRLTLDYMEDYQLIREVYWALSRINENFGMDDVLDYFEENPHLWELNAKYHGETWMNRKEGGLAIGI